MGIKRPPGQHHHIYHLNAHSTNQMDNYDISDLSQQSLAFGSYPQPQHSAIKRQQVSLLYPGPAWPTSIFMSASFDTPLPSSMAEPVHGSIPSIVCVARWSASVITRPMCYAGPTDPPGPNRNSASPSYITLASPTCHLMIPRHHI